MNIQLTKILIFVLFSNVAHSLTFLNISKKFTAVEIIDMRGQQNKQSGSYFIRFSKSFDVNKYIHIYTGANRMVNQIKMEYYECTQNRLDPSNLFSKAKAFFDFSSKKIFGKKVYFDNLINKKPLVFYNKKNPSFKKVRAKKTEYKCDGKGGKGITLDLFIKEKGN